MRAVDSSDWERSHVRRVVSALMSFLDEEVSITAALPGRPEWTLPRAAPLGQHREETSYLYRTDPMVLS